MIDKNQSVLVTGGTGFIGSYIIRKLITEGFTKVHAIQRSTSSFDLIPSAIREKVTWHICDMTDFDELDRLVIGKEVIIHCAAVVSFWPRQYEMMHKINHLAVKRLVEIAEKHQVEHFVHLSSVEALGHQEEWNNEESAYDESTALSEYSIAKHRGDLEIQSSSLNYTIYHPGFVLGGGHWEKAPLSFIKMIYDGMRFYPSGMIGLVDVRDIAQVLVDNLKNKSMYKSQYILVSDNVKHQYYFEEVARHLQLTGKFRRLKEPIISIAVFVESMKARFTKVAPLITRETYAISTKNLRYDNQKIANAIQFEFRTVEESLEDLCRCFMDTYPKQKYGYLHLD